MLGTLSMQITANRLQRAFTLIELMVVIVVVGVILVLAAPSMSDFIGMQRLRAINDQLVTDLQYMRTEAVSRNQFTGFIVRNNVGDSLTCYVIFASSVSPLEYTALNPGACNCSNAVGSVCTGTQRELRTVQVPRDLSIALRVHSSQPPLLIMSPVSGGAQFYDPDTLIVGGLEYCVEVTRTPRGRLRTGINPSGRATVCSPDGSVPGVPVCAAYDATVRNCQVIS